MRQYRRMSEDPRHKRRRGRPRADTETDRREAIVEAAGKEFAAGGFAQTSMRAIARSAGVDPALVHHYFANKEELFLAAAAMPVNPLEILQSALPDPAEVDSFGTELLRIVVPVWDRPEVSGRITAVIKSVTDEPSFSGLIEEFLRDRLFALIVDRIGAFSPADHDAAFARFHAVMLGVITARYLAKTSSLVSMSAEAVAETFGPMIDLALGQDHSR